MDVMCFDKSRGLIKESEHPFTSGYGTSDVRITNHYYEDLLISSIFSCLSILYIVASFEKVIECDCMRLNYTL